MICSQVKVMFIFGRDEVGRKSWWLNGDVIICCVGVVTG